MLLENVHSPLKGRRLGFIFVEQVTAEEHEIHFFRLGNSKDLFERVETVIF
jgi:hypothetical protein